MTALEALVAIKEISLKIHNLLSAEVMALYPECQELIEFLLEERSYLQDFKTLLEDLQTDFQKDHLAKSRCDEETKE